MRDRGVDADEQIAQREHRGGVGEIIELRHRDAVMPGSRESASASSSRNSRCTLTKLTPGADSSGLSCANDTERFLSLGCAARPDQANATRGDGSLSRRAAIWRATLPERGDKGYRPGMFDASVLQASGRLPSGQCRS